VVGISVGEKFLHKIMRDTHPMFCIFGFVNCKKYFICVIIAQPIPEKSMMQFPLII